MSLIPMLLEERKRLAESIAIGTLRNNENREKNTMITANRFRGSNSDEVNQEVFSFFSTNPNYHISTHEENGHAHIRLYAKQEQVLYVLLREGTYLNVVKEADGNKDSGIHYLFGYANTIYFESSTIEEESKSSPSPQFGQLTLFDDESSQTAFRKQQIRNRVSDVVGIITEIKDVILITYDINNKGEVIMLNARILKPNFIEDAGYKENWSELLVDYSVAPNTEFSSTFSIEEATREQSKELDLLMGIKPNIKIEENK
ncbi:DUF5986 family protein [Paenibacillus humicola]|uniref:DUF5986 family protein n=1 Tax=Paenibacillus humicola TaxID=3110540 RepID=UPI00237B2936|nr:DUF5986 family protein [Paenibacillus humicola]